MLHKIHNDFFENNNINRSSFIRDAITMHPMFKEWKDKNE